MVAMLTRHRPRVGVRFCRGLEDFCSNSASIRLSSRVRVFVQMIAAVLDEYGIQLQATPGTAWTRMPADVRKEIEASDPRNPTD